MTGFSIIIPVYNEEELIEKNLYALRNFLNANKHKDYEIIIANNGSTDKTVEIVEKLSKKEPKIKLLSVEERGVGLAFRKAVLSSNYENIISVDMDLSTELDFINKAIELFKDYDVIIGSKKELQKRHFLRRFLSAVFIILVKLLLRLPYSDYSMAAKAYKKDAILSCINRIDSGSSYVIEIINFAHKNNKKLIEIPVACTDKRKSKFNILAESFYRGKNLLKLLFGL